MAWVRLDDRFDEHPKQAAVGPLGIALWATGLAYCNRNMTDGFIPWATARTLVSWDFIGPPGPDLRRARYGISVTSGMSGEDVTSDFVIGLLLAADLWEEVDNGYRVHDYASYQPTREVIEAEERGKRPERVRGGRARAADAERIGGRFAPKGSPAHPPAQSDVLVDAGTSTSGVNRQHEHQHDTSTPASDPDPDPDPDPDQISLVPSDLSGSVGAAPPLTLAQSALLLALHRGIADRVYGGSAAPPNGWCEDLIRRGATPSDVECAIVAMRPELGARAKGLRYGRAVIERRVEEREHGHDPDERPAGGAGTARRGTHGGAPGPRGVAAGGAGRAPAARSEYSDDFTV